MLVDLNFSDTRTVQLQLHKIVQLEMNVKSC